MIAKSLLTALTVLTVLQYARCDVKTVKTISYNITTYIICTPANSSGENTSECPTNSQCIEIQGYGKHTEGKTNTEGLCQCKPKFMVNRKFNASDSASLYCVEQEEVTTTTTTVAPTQPPTTASPSTPSTSTTKAPETTAKPSTSSAAPQKSTTVAPKVETTTAKASDNVDVKPAPEPPRKSIFGSIVVPVMVVLGLIGFIFVARKYNMVDRTRNYIRNRGGHQHQTRYDGLENDFDDDPLLI